MTERDESEQPKRREYDFAKPFRVLIVEDCRPEEDLGESGRLSGQLGTCLGMYDFETLRQDLEEGNPLIHAESGDLIWGMECWWAVADDTPLDELQIQLALKKIELQRAAMGERIDPSLN